MNTAAKGNIRYSKKREAMLHLMQQTKTHPSAEWIFQQLKSEYPDLSLGTVYRNLGFFQEQNMIKSVGVVQGQERFDADTSEHCHFFCEICGKVEDLHQISIQGKLQEQLEELQIAVERSELNLYGRCQDCLADSEVNPVAFTSPVLQ